MPHRTITGMLEVFSLPPFLCELEHSLLLHTLRRYPSGLPADEPMDTGPALPTGRSSPSRTRSGVRSPSTLTLTRAVRPRVAPSAVSMRGVRSIACAEADAPARMGAADEIRVVSVLLWLWTAC
jgi:hypothetical protein